MHDWQALVEVQLAGLPLEPQESAEVIAEVAAHLQELCEAMCREGIAQEEAARRALSRVGGWHELRHGILVAKRKEHPMQKRVQQLWIPGFLTLILSMVLLAVLQKSGWPARVVGPHSALLYLPWLATLPLPGALATYLSGRAGGSRGTTLLASIFPVVALGGAFLLMFPIGWALQVVIGRSFDFGWVATVLLKDAIGWIVTPGAALLLGGLLARLLLGARPSIRAMVIG